MSEVKQGTVPQTWWSYEEVGHTQDAKQEIVKLFGDDAFSTPKPERLLHRIERDFLYVTTAALNHEQLQQLSDEVGPERTLLVLCRAFQGRDEYPNLTVKKISKQVLNRCEWGHDDYSLRVENLLQ